VSDYTQNTDFSAKDSLPSGDAEKAILGADFDAEFAEIETAVLSKYDDTDLADQSTAEAGTSSTTLMTPERVQQWGEANILGGTGIDITSLTVNMDVDSLSEIVGSVDSTNDFVPVYDASAGTVVKVAASVFGAGGAGTVTEVATGTGLTGGPITSSGTVSLDTSNARNVDHSAVSVNAGTGLSGGGTIDSTVSLSLSFTDFTDGFEASDIAETSEVLIQVEGTPRRMAMQDSGIRVTTNTTTSPSTSVKGDNQSLKVFTNASPGAYTIAPNASVDYPVGAGIVVHTRSGNLTITPGSGVTFDSVIAQNSSASRTLLAGGTCILAQVETDRWAVSGDIA
jgi:hypothetical protein